MGKDIVISSRYIATLIDVLRQFYRTLNIAMFFKYKIVIKVRVFSGVKPQCTEDWNKELLIKIKLTAQIM